MHTLVSYKGIHKAGQRCVCEAFTNLVQNGQYNAKDEADNEWCETRQKDIKVLRGSKFVISWNVAEGEKKTLKRTTYC